MRRLIRGYSVEMAVKAKWVTVDSVVLFSEKQVFYLVNEAQMPGKGADSVVSMAPYYLKYYIVWGRRVCCSYTLR